MGLINAWNVLIRLKVNAMDHHRAEIRQRAVFED